MSSNESSQFQARELKSVYTDVITLLLKVVFHHPFMNELNQFNQVGLVALNCMGELEPIQRVISMNQTLADDTLDTSFSPFLGLQPQTRP